MSGGERDRYHWLVGWAEEFVQRHWRDGLGWDADREEPLREPDPAAAARELMALHPDDRAAAIGNIAHFWAMESDLVCDDNFSAFVDELEKLSHEPDRREAAA